MSDPRSSGGSSRGWWLIRLLLAVGTLAWVARRIDVRELGPRVRELGVMPLFASFSLVIACVALGSLRWGVLLRAYGASEVPSFFTLMRQSMIALYLNMLPGGVAGEAVRGYSVRKSAGDLATSYAIVVVERVAGMAALVLLAACGTLLGGRLASPDVSRVLRFASVACAIVGIASIGLPYLVERNARAREWVAAIPKLGPRLAAVRAPRSAGLFAIALVISLFTQVAIVLATLVLFPLGRDTDVIAMLRVTPAVVLLTVIPITPAALGQRELVYVQLYALAGVSAVVATAASIRFLAVALACAAVGGLCLIGLREPA